MEKEEVAHIVGAVIIFTAILSFKPVLNGNYSLIGMAIVSSAVIIATNIYGKKFMARLLDADVEHRTWTVSRFGFRPNQRFKSPFKAGIFLPLIFSVLSLGSIMLSSFLTYEASARKERAAKRFGYYSYTEMTDWHNALIGAAGIITTLIVLVISYLTGFEPLAKAAAFYVFWNMIPISDLDGTQIFFGSKVIWAILATISLLVALYSVTII